MEVEAIMSPQTEGELNKSTGVGGETGDLETESESVRGSVAGVETVGTSGVCMELANGKAITLETCLNEGLKGTKWDEDKPKETMSSEDSEGMTLSGGLALPEEAVLSEETRGANRDE